MSSLKLITSMAFLLFTMLSCAGYSTSLRLQPGITELPPRSVAIAKNSYISYLSSSSELKKNDQLLTLRIKVGSNLNVNSGFSAVKDLILSGEQYYYFELECDGLIYRPRGSANNKNRINGSGVETINLKFKLPKELDLSTAKIRYTGPRNYKGDQVWLDIGLYLTE